MNPALVPTYRPLTEADLQAATYVRKAASESLARAEGREPWAWQPRGPAANMHLLHNDPGGSWAAEIDGLLVGYSQALVRGDIWYLGQLFVQPEVHGLGIGREVLHRAQEYGRARGARVFAVVSSTSPVAQGLYMRAGMFPLGIAYHIGGPVEALRALPEPSGSRKRIVDCEGWQERIGVLDRAVFGAERPADHALSLSWNTVYEATESFAVVRDGEFRGYAYADTGGIIGPVAAWEPEEQLPLLRMAGDWLAEREVGEARMLLISTNRVVMRALLERRWRIARWNFFLASEAFGQFDRYVPSGGLLL